MFKVGDKVRIRKDLIIGNEYGGLDFLKSMDMSKGKTVTITHITEGGNYDVKENYFTWSGEMLEPAELSTGDMLNALAANPEVKYFFERNGWKHIMRLEDGYYFLDIYNSKGELVESNLAGGGFNGNVTFGAKWTLVTVPFLDAVKAYGEGKTIRCETKIHGKQIYRPSGMPLADTLKSQDGHLRVREILEGTWTIED
jgi:hypothetical protein